MARTRIRKSETSRYRIRKARVSDVARIRELISLYASQDLMLPRSLNDIYECLRDYWVCEKGGKVVACAALHVDWEDLAEVRSLAVVEKEQSRGIGTRLLRRCIREARQLGIRRVFALTYVPAFFEKHGFRAFPKEELPRKIWAECIRCHKFPDCDETALVLEV
jgi:amino-acid N-acetyltransferase